MPKARLTFEECGSPRYYLEDEPLHAGDLVDMQLENGKWTSGRYEYSWNRRSQAFHASLSTAQQYFDNIDTLNLRWPGID